MRALIALLGLLPCAAGAALANGVGPAAAVQSPGGRELFLAQCGGCHLENGFGTRVLARRVPAGQALLERRENLSGELVRLAVRRGVGAMPQIRRTELGDREFESIARYLEDGE